MKTLTTLLLAAAIVLGGAHVAATQTLATRTTLAADATATATVITVTSGTGFTAGNMVWIDFEQMQITAVNTTAISVRRGQNGTRAAAHDNTDGVITGAADHFHTNPPDTGADCTRGAGQAAFSPWIDVRSGWIWICDNNITADWSGTLKSHKTVDSEPTSF